MDSGAEERFLAAQADANEKRLDLERKLLAMQQDFKDSIEKQQREFRQFQQLHAGWADTLVGWTAAAVLLRRAVLRQAVAG